MRHEDLSLTLTHCRALSLSRSVSLGRKREVDATSDLNLPMTDLDSLLGDRLLGLPVGPFLVANDHNPSGQGLNVFRGFRDPVLLLAEPSQGEELGVELEEAAHGLRDMTGFSGTIKLKGDKTHFAELLCVFVNGAPKENVLWPLDVGREVRQRFGDDLYELDAAQGRKERSLSQLQVGHSPFLRLMIQSKVCERAFAIDCKREEEEG